MKKALSLMFAATLVLGVFTGCGAENGEEKTTGTAVEFSGTDAKIDGGGCLKTEF